ncbi:hypothetical protein GOP47_0020905 [Adiantum capillus-veneris]|uniref:Uncharacterized protein n=1 Tax=Adiantum capillus-veneris TaxID=13818 RepID=A0A9D4UAA4_ADICA|nr:hypothetical protein GOP47_0020905 [Adiantum capillus-veneris]
MEGEGDVLEGVKITPDIISCVFGLPLLEDPPMVRITDQLMRAEFGAPSVTKNYYMVQQSNLLQHWHVKW